MSNYSSSRCPRFTRRGNYGKGNGSYLWTEEWGHVTGIGSQWLFKCWSYSFLDLSAEFRGFNLIIIKIYRNVDYIQN
jgi:hypothetical protein